MTVVVTVVVAIGGAGAVTVTVATGGGDAVEVTIATPVVSGTVLVTVFVTVTVVGDLPL